MADNGSGLYTYAGSHRDIIRAGDTRTYPRPPSQFRYNYIIQLRIAVTVVANLIPISLRSIIIEVIVQATLRY